MSGTTSWRRQGDICSFHFVSCNTEVASGQWFGFFHSLISCFMSCHFPLPAHLCSQCSVSLQCSCASSSSSAWCFPTTAASLALPRPQCLSTWFVSKPVVVRSLFAGLPVSRPRVSCACPPVVACSPCSWFVPYDFLVCFYSSLSCSLDFPLPAFCHFLGFFHVGHDYINARVRFWQVQFFFPLSLVSFVNCLKTSTARNVTCGWVKRATVCRLHSGFRTNRLGKCLDCGSPEPNYYVRMPCIPASSLMS